MLVEILSTLSAGLFAGAAIYINMVEHPARMQCSTELAIPEFSHSYRRGAVFMGTLLMSGVISATAAGVMYRSVWWLIGACVLLSLIPFTLVVIFPINKKLLDSSLDKNSELAATLLTRWGRYHTIRSLLGLASFLIFIFSLVRETWK